MFLFNFFFSTTLIIIKIVADFRMNFSSFTFRLCICFVGERLILYTSGIISNFNNNSKENIFFKEIFCGLYLPLDCLKPAQKKYKTSLIIFGMLLNLYRQTSYYFQCIFLMNLQNRIIFDDNTKNSILYILFLNLS